MMKNIERLKELRKLSNEAHEKAANSTLHFGPDYIMNYREDNYDYSKENEEISKQISSGEIQFYNETIIGTCSLCGGPVVIPTIYGSINPPVPTCKQCGAFKKERYGPVIEMEKPKDIQQGGSTPKTLCPSVGTWGLGGIPKKDFKGVNII